MTFSDSQLETIPAQLVDCEQWVCWRETVRDGKPTKLPVDASTGQIASTTDPATWADIETVLEYVEQPTTSADGIGFVFTDDDPFVGIDLDDCRTLETGADDEWAIEIIDRLDSYTEVSPSGTGYHVIVRGALQTDRNRKGDLEIYETARFFTVTGDHVDRTPKQVTDRSDVLQVIQQEYLETTVDDESEHRARTRSSSEAEVDLADTELIEKATAAKNGDRFERLWEGSTAGYDSHSEADMALCFYLAFWTGGDQSRVDRLFRRSGLIREKWDQIHYADGSTYGEKTVERAVAKTTDVYTPRGTDETTAVDTGQLTSVDEYRRRTVQQPYLAERNRLLEERITELEAAIEQRDNYIERLEARTDHRRESSTRDEQAEDEERSDESGDEVQGRTDTSSPVWSYFKRILGRQR
ncbi:phage NrS-1 polymerase family protein [Halococcus sp. AFM35]|uniref:phage NrS-1 polymerase family protein n=1 Tax=Halococcus sp. AFM35 TaxID=3421653 RepID=UPI003EBC40F4